MNTLLALSIFFIVFLISQSHAEKNTFAETRIGNMQSDHDLILKKTNHGQFMRYWDSRKPRPNIGFLGKGYDVVYGNVKETSIGGDMGYRSPVFQMDFSEETMVPDWRFLTPKNVDITPRMFCDSSISHQSISTSDELKDSISTATKQTYFKQTESKSWFHKSKSRTETSKSTSYKRNSERLATGDKVIIQSEAKCSVYQADLNSFEWPPLDPGFEKAARALPEDYGSNPGAYKKFIETYGTDVVTSALFGSRFGKLYILEKSTLNEKFSEEQSKSESKSWERSGGVSFIVSVEGGKSGSRAEKSASALAKENSLSQMSLDEEVYSVGAQYADDPHEWLMDTEKDPAPIEIQTLSMHDVFNLKIDKKRGASMYTAIGEYFPAVSSDRVGENMAICYVHSNQHLVYNFLDKRASLVARCKPGYKIMGGTFTHLWNHEGDVRVDELASTAQRMMSDLQLFHNLESQQDQVKYIMENGVNMMKEYIEANAKDHVKELFGDDFSSGSLAKFLSGTLTNLNLEKSEALKQIGEGWKVVTNSPLGEAGVDMAKKNPFIGSIFKVGTSIAKSLPRHLVLDANMEDAAHRKKIEDHAKVLIEMLKTIDDENNRPHTIRDESNTEIFDAVHQFVNGILSPIVGEVKKHMTDKLSEWGGFTGIISNLYKNFSQQLDKNRGTMKLSSLFRDSMQDVKAESNIHGTTILAQRNSLSWLFPFSEDAWICGSGNVGTKPTSRSSMGYCSAFCCANLDWEFENAKSRIQTTDEKSMTAVVTASCPSGFQVISGGMMLASFEEGRFVQPVFSAPLGESQWKCGIKWTEETYIPFAPKFQCYARCAKSRRMQCETKKVPLLDGHATVHCGTDQMAVSGGWAVKTTGVSYFKRTLFRDVQTTEGPRGFRCEMGTSHGRADGDCYARCCDVISDSALAEVLKDAECKPFFQRARLENGHFTGYWSADSPGQQLVDSGSSLRSLEHLKNYQILISRNGQFFAFWNAHANELWVYEELGCDYPHLIGRVQMKGVDVGTVSQSFASSSHQASIGERPGIFDAVGGPPILELTDTGLKSTVNGIMIAHRDISDRNVEYMRLSDSGDIVFYDVDDKALQSFKFSECRALYKRKKFTGQEMNVGEALSLGQGLVRHFPWADSIMLWFTPGGALVVLRSSKYAECPKPDLLWSSNESLKSFDDVVKHNAENEKDGWLMRLQEDNNLVIYDDENAAKWSTDTHTMGTGSTRVELTIEGEVKLIDAIGVVLWSNLEGKSKSCETLRQRLKIRSHRMGVGSPVMKPGLGGLVSKNEEYIIYIREEDGQSNLELWQEAGIDCKPLRRCTIASNVRSIELRENGVFVQNQKKYLFKPEEGMKFNELTISKDGRLWAHAGSNHRREVSVNMNGECTVMPQVKDYRAL
mmetsp:Transcript_2200/g.8058  ORF Transcript_2200/g.8058 Transcript_2200/m.8058 type:complete len:1395 (-) Transcript_2200:90-4274(-)|eukprot:CAMPEP_0117441952 /NCGR_PEP_ID=MMETSP0759-20121206/3898_1 /TAXON_ID=63605 /ORGANISM="Percolomonas cosmopolitus, Strain WS" /LENGTH=1394 /DNA_ID=CAMNT_0005233819 /DNA_START=282 /DNA_END=4466 /DNA_ORIENTATION=+